MTGVPVENHDQGFHEDMVQWPFWFNMKNKLKSLPTRQVQNPNPYPYAYFKRPEAVPQSAGFVVSAQEGAIFLHTSS